MAYSTDADLEMFMPDVLDLGLPDQTGGGLKTTLGADAAAGDMTLKFQDTTDLAAGEYFRVGEKTNAEILEATSVAGEDVTFTTAARKLHKSNTKVEQVMESGFANDHDLAKADIDRMIERDWFLPEVRDRSGGALGTSIVFDPGLMLNANIELGKLSSYWVLGNYVLPRLAKRQDDEDYYSRKAKEFLEKAMVEYELILATGIDYDWDQSGIIEDHEKSVSSEGFRIYRT